MYSARHEIQRAWGGSGVGSKYHISYWQQARQAEAPPAPDVDLTTEKSVPAQPEQGDAEPMGFDIGTLTQALPMLELVLRHGRRQVKFYESHMPISRASYFRLKSQCVKAGWLRQSPCRRFIEPVPDEIRSAVRKAFPMIVGDLDLAVLISVGHAEAWDRI